MHGNEKLLFLAVLGLLILGTLLLPGKKAPVPWEGELGPWAVPRSPTEAAISWMGEGPGTVEYAPAADYQAGGKLHPGPASQGEAELQHVTLTGLAPGTRYAYRIRVKNEVSPLSYFTVPPEDFRPFTFLVYGDTRTNYDQHALVAERMATEPAEFVVHVGDLIESPTDGQWRAFLKSGEPLFRSMSFLCVIGNHENNSRSYYDLFPLPEGGGKYGHEWWSLRWGDVLLVGLDSNLPFLKFTGLQRETEWMKEVLSQDARYKFVFFHHPLYSSDPYYGGDENLAKLWVPIFQEAGVTAVFTGHCHNYEHIVRDGIQYFVTGGGGAPLSGLSPERVEGSVLGVEDVLHYLRVTVTAEGAQVEMVPVAKVEGGNVTELSGEPMETVELVPQAAPVP